MIDMSELEERIRKLELGLSVLTDDVGILRKDVDNFDLIFEGESNVDKKERAILNVIEENPGITTTEVCNKVLEKIKGTNIYIGKNKILKLIIQLINKGKIKRIRLKRNQYKYEIIAGHTSIFMDEVEKDEKRKKWEDNIESEPSYAEKMGIE